MSLEVSLYADDYETGDGVRFSSDGCLAWLLKSGQVSKEISIHEGSKIVRGLGMPPPDKYSGPKIRDTNINDIPYPYSGSFSVRCGYRMNHQKLMVPEVLFRT